MMLSHLEWFGSNSTIPSLTHSCFDLYRTLEGKLSGRLLALAGPIFPSQPRCSQPNHLCFCPVVGIPTATKNQLFSVLGTWCVALQHSCITQLLEMQVVIKTVSRTALLLKIVSTYLYWNLNRWKWESKCEFCSLAKEYLASLLIKWQIRSTNMRSRCKHS